MHYNTVCQLIKLNVFLFNLPAYLVRMVHLRSVTTLEDAMKIVCEEQDNGVRTHLHEILEVLDNKIHPKTKVSSFFPFVFTPHNFF